MRTSVVDFATDLMTWWKWELASVFGRGTSARRPGAATLRLGRDGVRIERPGGSPVHIAGVDDPADTGARLREVLSRRERRAGVEILIAPDRHLRRPLSSLRLPRSRMAAMARLDLASATPFATDECLVLLPTYRRDAAESAYHLVRRSHVEPLLQGLRRAGVRVLGVALAGANDVVPVDRKSTRSLVPPRLVSRLLGGTRRVLVSTALIGALVIVGLLHWRQTEAARALDREIAVAEVQAAEIRRALDERNRRLARIAAVRSAKSEAVPFVSVLEELARILPETTWLTEVEFSDETVTFSGKSRAAAALIPSLEESPLFSTPVFSQPVVRDAELGGERFTITMQTETADG